MAALDEQYRPQSFAEVVGQDKAIHRLRTLARRGYGGNMILLTGKPGTGKTTLARIIAREMTGNPDTIREYDASELTPARLRDIEETWPGRPLYAAGWAIIVNEIHGLRCDAIRQLLVLKERLPEYVVWIFTTTLEGQLSFDDHTDGKAFQSRCVRVQLAQRDLCRPFAERAKWIAGLEGLDGAEPSAYENLAKECGNDLRAMLTEIAAGRMLRNEEPKLCPGND